MSTFNIQFRIKILNLTVSQGIGSLLTELSSQLNTGIAPPPVGEVTQKTTRLGLQCQTPALSKVYFTEKNLVPKKF